MGVVVKPLGQRVIVRVERPQDSQTDAGVILLASDAPPVVGEVVACVDNPDVSVGAVVIFSRSAGMPLEWDGAPHVVLDLDEILGEYLYE